MKGKHASGGKKAKDGGKRVKFNQIGGKLLKKHSSNSSVFKLKSARPESLVFDQKAREEYVTGFQKRRTQRKIQGAEALAAKKKRERLQERKERREGEKKAAEEARAQRAVLVGEDNEEEDEDSTDSSDDEEQEDRVSTEATMQFEGGASSVVVVTEAMGGPEDELQKAQKQKKEAYEARKAKEAKEAARERHKLSNKPKTYIKKSGGIRHRGKNQSKRAKKKK